jgi:chemosensory pili system protein ChpA (sensor histidine kinase/response regulator)
MRPLILVVDDDVDILDFAGMLLERAYYDVVTAPSGRAALRSAHEHRPDLILLDIEMPEMNGVELVMRLRIDPMLGSVPIVLYSGDPNLSVKAEMLQAEGFLAKPCASHRILDEIARVLDASRPRAARGAPRHAARP